MTMPEVFSYDTTYRPIGDQNSISPHSEIKSHNFFAALSLLSKVCQAVLYTYTLHYTICPCKQFKGSECEGLLIYLSALEFSLPLALISKFSHVLGGTAESKSTFQLF